MRTSELREMERQRAARRAPPRDAKRVVRFRDAEPWRGKAKDFVESEFRECGQRIFEERTGRR